MYFRDPVFVLEPGCSHSTVVSDLCADCGADLRIDNASKPTASVSMIHSVPDLKVSEQVLIFYFCMININTILM